MYYVPGPMINPHINLPGGNYVYFIDTEID